MIAALRVFRRPLHAFAAAAAALTMLAAPASADIRRFEGGPAPAAAAAAAAELERVLPAAVAPSDVDRIEGQQVAPFLSSSGDRLVVYSALGAPSIAKDPSQGFTLDVDHTPLRIAPTWTASAGSDSAMVDRNAAVFPGLATSTDVVVRPTAAGIGTFLQIRDGLARGSFDWTVELRAGERLCELDDGSVAVVAGSCGEDKATGERTTPIAGGVADSRTQYDRSKDRHAEAAERVGGEVVAVFHPPAAQDADGRAITTGLKARGAIVSLTVRHNRGLTSYPAVAALEVSYADAWRRGWTHVDGIGPAQRIGGLVRALMPSGKTLMTHGPDPADTEELERDPTQEWDTSDQAAPQQGDEEGDRAEQGGTPFDQDSDEGIDPFADDPDDRNANAPIGGSGPPFVCGDADTPRLTLVYAGASTAGLTDATQRRIGKVMTQMNDKLYGESIASASGSRANPARFRVSCAEKGVPEIKAIETTSNDVVTVVQAAIDQGVNDPDSKYLIFSETEEPNSCGIGDIKEDDSLSVLNQNNEPTVLNPSETVQGGWAVLWGRGCWTADYAMHENGHTMGAVQESAPGGNGEDVHGEALMHCTDGYDVMCYEDFRDLENLELRAPYSNDECPLGNRGVRYDCHYDSYFDTSPEDGEYLDRHWNIGARVNLFLSFAKPRPFHEPYVLLAGYDFAAGGIHRAADGRGTPELIYDLTDHPTGRGFALHPSLAPDGKRVVFAGEGDTEVCTDIYTMSLEGGPRQLVFDCMAHGATSATRPEFMSDGRIAFDQAGKIWWVRTDGTDLRKVIDWSNDWAGQTEPTYSGSGKLMAFVSFTDEDGDSFGLEPGAGWRRSALFIAKRHGESPVQFTPLSRFSSVSDPKFSHDGAWISFVGVRPGQPGGSGNVYIARIDGSGLRRISDLPGGYAPEWTPTGRIAYFQQLDGTDGRFARLVKEDIGDGSRVTLDEDFEWGAHVAFRQASYPIPGKNDPSNYEIPEYGPLP